MLGSEYPPKYAFSAHSPPTPYPTCPQWPLSTGKSLCWGGGEILQYTQHLLSSAGK